MSPGKTIELEVAILGGGFTGVYSAKAAAALTRNPGARLGLISEENYMVFQPMLPEVVGSSISPRHVANPLRLLCRPAEVFKGRVEAVDWPNRSLTLNAGPFSGDILVRFRHLVLALGAIVDLSRIPGMPEHAFLMRNVGDAMHLRTTLIGRMEEANLEPDQETRRRLLTFVVVGGGYSGVETAGHILDLFRSIGEYYANVPAEELRVFLVHSRGHLLPTLSQSLGDYAARQLQKRGLKLLLNQRVKAVTAERVYLNDGSTIETNTVISTVGNAPHPLIVQLCDQYGFTSVHGQIETEATGQVKGQTHLWAGGDCAAFPYAKGGFCPATAQFGLRQGTLIGRNLVRFVRQQPLRTFQFRGYGEMASIGHHTAVADIFGLHFSGFLAWWMWRSVYLAKLPRLDRKIRVMLDWTLDLFFPLDINHLSPRFSALLKEMYLQPGDVLFQHGEPAFSLYIVKSGRLNLRDPDGLSQTVAAGDYFGEHALLSDGVWHHDATAAEPTWLLSVPATVFKQIVQGAGSLGRFFQRSANKYQSREVLKAIERKIRPELADKPVADLMQRDLFLFRSDMTSEEALEMARLNPRSSYPLVDGDGQLVAVARRDDLYEFVKRPDTTAGTLVKDMRLSSLPTLDGDSTVGHVLQHLIRSGFNKALVLDSTQRPVGIITILDILAAEAQDRLAEKQTLSGQEISARR
ncbi:MAG: FAD-dependent oxidoreductase [Verrucomicrobiota bacterium]